MTKPWERFISPVDRPRIPRPETVTWVITIFSLLGACFEAIIRLDGAAGSVALAFGMSGAFLVRQVNPALSIALIGGSSFTVDMTAFATQHPIDMPIASVFIGAATLFTLVRNATPRVVLAVIVVYLVVLPMGEFTNPVNDGQISVIVTGTLINAALLAVVLVVRANDGRIDARSLEEEVNERNRLANDIHDSVAHHMSAIAIRAEAALQYSDPIEMSHALADIKRSSSTGLSDMRHLVTALRHDIVDSSLLPGLGEIRQLATETTTRQLTVEVDIEPGAEIVPLTVSAVAYAICREGMTNVRRHATDASLVEITVRLVGPSLNVRVSNNGSVVQASTATGNGLISMNQRATAIGGQLTAGPRPSGGWLVAVQLPISATNK